MEHKKYITMTIEIIVPLFEREPLKMETGFFVDVTDFINYADFESCYAALDASFQKGKECQIVIFSPTMLKYLGFFFWPNEQKPNNKSLTFEPKAKQRL